MKIGVHPSNLHLMLARSWPGAFASLEPQFVLYPEGRDTGRLLHEGRIDFGGTGSTPPIVSEANSLRVSYLAASAPRPANGGIFVRKDSAVRSVGDLKGKRVTLIDGSFHTYLLARAIEGEGLHLPDIETVELKPEDSLDALLGNRVDAWIAMAPRLEKALERDDIRLIARCGDTIPNRSVFWTLAGRRNANDARAEILAELARVGREVQADPARAAALLAAARIGDGDAAAWERVIRSRDFSVVAADAAIVQEQQDEADTLYRHGYLDQPVQLGSLPNNERVPA